MPAKTTAAPETHSLVIEGNLVRFTKTIVERQVRTSDLLTELGRMQPLDTGLLPRGCIAFSRCNDSRNQVHALYAIERPAGLVCIRYKKAGSQEEQKDDNIISLTLSWPHTIWLVHWTGPAISDLYVCCAKAPIQSLEDAIFVLPMPNIYDSGHAGVCLGNLTLPDASSPNIRSVFLIETVLTSLWNIDLQPDYEPLGFKSLEEWAERSAADGQFGLSLDYKPHHANTLGNLMATILGEPA
ncbi:MAG: hypothetical protein ABSE73_00030 [Planctomycetota bacterium]